MKMTKKIEETYIYEGLGFPIELNHVEMIFVHGEFVPKIDVKSVANKAIKDLILQKTKLTGNQIKFIRSYFLFSLRDFSEVVNESHAAVRKWENFNNQPTNMDPNIEKTIRIYILDKVCIKNKEDKLKFYDQYHVIHEIVSQQKNKNSRHLELIA